MDQEALTAMLDACLLTEEEMAPEKKEWRANLPDPFPEWTLDED